MSDQPVIIMLTGIILLLLAVTGYQQLMFRKGIQEQLKKLSDKLADILDQDTSEQVMVFTDDKVLKRLCGQMNRMLLDRQKVKTDYRKQQLSAKKMLSNISHDIKTPLTVILGYLEMMRIGQEDNSMLQKVEGKARQVLEMIDQFFTLAKLEAGDMHMEQTKIDISERCREIVLDFYELLIQKDFTVQLSIPEQKFYVLGDQKSVDRILNNLLSNAVRYGSDGNYLGLFLREEEHMIAIDIVDKGRGIEKEFAANVFERLYTMEDSRSRQIQGNGLGLTIAKNLAVQMGGDLSLDSEPGVKTVFTVRLKRTK